MKLIVFGREFFVRRIKAALLVSNNEVTALSWDQLSSRDNMIFDLAIIEMTCENADNACRTISQKFEIPLILIVKHQQADWYYLDSFNAAGYISDDFSESELIARLEAIFRRFQSVIPANIQAR